jgi:hypothetical protein
VYCHTFPNGKKYIGITKTDTDKRWRNGDGYKSQPKMARAIAKYGWDNVAHEVLAVGLDHDKANEMEQYYIAKYDTLNNGYNATIGGDNIVSCYLDSYVLEMLNAIKIHAPKEYERVKIAYDDRYNKDAAGFWNEAANAVVRKHGRFSATDDMQVAYFWFYIGEYCDLYCRMQRGEDVRKWREREPAGAVLEWFFNEAVVSG